MSRVIGLDIEGRRITAVELTRGKQPTVGATFQSDAPGPFTVKNAEALGHWLKDELAKAGFQGTDTVVVLSRGRINLKSLDVPAGPPDELPAMVAFSVEGELASPAGEGVLDYQASPGVDGSTVLAAMASAEEVEAIAATLKFAKLSCRHIAPRAHATHFAAEQSFDRFGHHTTLVVAPQKGLFEISAWRSDALAAYRSIPLSDGEDPGKRIGAEVRRTVASLQVAERPMAIDQIGVVGNGVELGHALAESTRMPVHHIDPCAKFGAPDLSNLPGYTSAMVAAWRELIDADWPIDFQKPKKPIVKRDTKRPALIMAAALGLLLPIGGYSYAQYLGTVKSHRIKYIAEQIEKTNKEYAALKPTIQRYEEIKRWADGDVNWLHELQALAAVFPDSSDAFVTKIEMRSNETIGQGQKPGTIAIEGLARDQSVINDANSRSAADTTMHYSPTPKGTGFSTERPDFQHSFKVDLAVRPLKDGEYVELHKAGLEKHAKSVPAGKRRDPASLGTTASLARSEGRPNPRVESTAARSAPASGESGGARSSRFNRTGGSSTVGSESGSPADDPVERLVSKIKGMSFEEREKFINSKEVPSFLRARVRKKLSEAKQ